MRVRGTYSASTPTLKSAREQIERGKKGIKVVYLVFVMMNVFYRHVNGVVGRLMKVVSLGAPSMSSSRPLHTVESL